MQHHRTAYRANLVEPLFDSDAVVADRRLDIASRGRQVGEHPAQAKADRADLAVALRHRAQRAHRIGDVLDRLVGIETAVEIESRLDLGLRVAQFDTRLNPPEQVGRDRDVTLLGIAVGEFAEMAVDAENFLQQHERRPAAALG